jgi:DNA-binding transcriptional LysR family regulator
VRLGELLRSDMVAVKLGGDLRQIAVASPEYLARHGRPQTPVDLHRHRCINWRQSGSRGLYAWEFCKDGAWFEVAVNGPLIVSHRDMALAAALQGVGVAFWSQTQAEPMKRAGWCPCWRNGRPRSQAGTCITPPSATRRQRCAHSRIFCGDRTESMRLRRRTLWAAVRMADAFAR